MAEPRTATETRKGPIPSIRRELDPRTGKQVVRGNTQYCTAWLVPNRQYRAVLQEWDGAKWIDVETLGPTDLTPLAAREATVQLRLMIGDDANGPAAVAEEL